MLKQILIAGMLLWSNLAFSKAVYHYSLNYQHDGSAKDELHISLQFKNNTKGVQIITVPDTVQNLKIRTQHAKLVETDKEGELILVSEPDAFVSLHYNIEFNNDFGLNPIGQKQLFAFLGQRVFIVPTQQEEDNLVRLSWHVPEHYTIINSFGVREREQSLPIFPKDLTQALFMGTQLSIQESKQDGRAFYFVTDLPNEKMADWVQQISQAMQQEYGLENDFYLGAFLTIPGCFEGGVCNAATAVKNATLFAVPAAFDTDFEHPFLIKRTIANENIRNWLGQATASGNDPELAWFFNGMAEFFALELLAKYNIITPAEYVKYYNYVYAEYQSMPLIRGHYSNLNKFYTQERLFESYPFTQGFLFGHFLQSEALSQNRPDLHHWLKGLMASSDSLRQLNQRTLLGSLQGHFPVVAKDWLRFFEQGEALPITTHLLGQPISSHQKHTRVPDYGLDLFQLYYRSMVVDLEENSVAMNDGVHEGQMVDAVSLPEHKWGELKFMHKQGDQLIETRITPIKKEIEVSQIILG